MKDIVLKYDSLNEFGEYLKNAKTQKAFLGESALKTSESGWAGTRTWDDAQNLMMFGDADAAKKIQQGTTNGKPIQSVKPQSKQKTILSYAGYAPCVPAYLSGSPRSMMRTVTIQQKAKVLTVVYNISANGGWSSTALAQASFKMLQALYKLEQKNGIRINLYVCDCSYSKGQHIMPVVKIKDSGQYFNLLKCAYPLVNPAMMRRHGFRWQEVTVGVGTSFSNGYGSAQYDNNVVRALIKKNLPQLKPDYVLGINDAYNCIDANELIKKVFTK